MTKENIDFLEAHRDAITEINNAETATKARKIDGELFRIMKEEFFPGYAYDGGCGSCLFDMTKLVYRKFDEWLAAQPKEINMNKVAANFPLHKNHHRK